MRGARLLVAAVLQAAAAGAGGGGGGAPGSGSGSGWGGSAPAPLPAVPPRTLTEPFTTADDDDEPLPGLDDDDDQDTNNTERGMYLGSPCEFTCNPKLHHVFCDPITGHCECDKKYPVRLGPTKGCAKPKSLGEQCFYRQACKYMDSHASCVQINHNAICQCDMGYHSVSYSKPYKKVFCTEDMALLTGDVPTLLGVCSGIALLAGLLCLVLHLYTRGRNPYSRPHHYADAHLPPPMFFSSETGIPLAVQGGRASSRGSIRSSAGSGGGGSSRRGLGAASRAGAARAAAILLISCHMQEQPPLEGADPHTHARAYTHPLPAAGDPHAYRRRGLICAWYSLSVCVLSECT